MSEKKKAPGAAPGTNNGGGKATNSMKNKPTPKQVKRAVAISDATALLEEVERLRVAYGIEQYRIAGEAGHSAQYYQEIMAGKRMPKISTVTGIIHALSSISGKMISIKIETEYEVPGRTHAEMFPPIPLKRELED